MKRSVRWILLLVVTTVGMLQGRLVADPPPQGPEQPVAQTSVSFHRLQFTVSRQRGKILFDGREVSGSVLAAKSKEVRLIETFDGLRFLSDKEFVAWVHKLRGTRTYTYDEVTQVAADGSTTVQPLVFFEAKERIDLDPKWHDWLDSRQVPPQEDQRALQQPSQQDIPSQAFSALVAAEERSADSLAVLSGATSLWEVELVPTGNQGFSSSDSLPFQTLFGGSQFAINAYAGYSDHSSSHYVRAYGRTSQLATAQALNSNPGYRIGSVRKLAGY